jgi:hypothetical protein
MFLAAALVALLALAGLGVGSKIIRSYYYVSADGETVAIMRGIQGSILGVRLQQPYLLGCVNDRGELSQISYGQQDAELGCELMRLQDLRPSERAQVSAGLPAGSLDEAIGQLRQLAQGSLLPLCVPAPAPKTTPSTGVHSGSGAPAGPPASTATSPTASSAPSSPTTAASKPARTTALPAPQQTPGTDCRATA